MSVGIAAISLVISSVIDKYSALVSPEKEDGEVHYEEDMGAYLKDVMWEKAMTFSHVVAYLTPKLKAVHSDDLSALASEILLHRDAKITQSHYPDISVAHYLRSHASSSVDLDIALNRDFAFLWPLILQRGIKSTHILRNTVISLKMLRAIDSIKSHKDFFLRSFYEKHKTRLNPILHEFVGLQLLIAFNVPCKAKEQVYTPDFYRFLHECLRLFESFKIEFSNRLLFAREPFNPRDFTV
jgi:hypothetical protein